MKSLNVMYTTLSALSQRSESLCQCNPLDIIYGQRVMRCISIDRDFRGQSSTALCFIILWDSVLTVFAKIKTLFWFIVKPSPLAPATRAACLFSEDYTARIGIY